jgi:hypothetical protein
MRRRRAPAATGWDGRSSDIRCRSRLRRSWRRSGAPIPAIAGGGRGSWWSRAGTDGRA